MRRFFLIFSALIFGALAASGTLSFADANPQIASPASVDVLALLDSPEKFLQPTESGRIASAGFGMTRNSGTRFHEGIDIRSVRKMKSGAPRDLVFAAMPGEIVHINRAASGSSYGRHVVLRHENSGVELYTLYAHMIAFSPKIAVGQNVRAGALLGMMGQTSNIYKIPKSGAHLHFEVGMRLGGNGFARWFSRAYGPGNAHGEWNGFNLVGADPIRFFETQKSAPALDFVRWLKTFSRDFSVRVPESEFPEILRRSPALFAGKKSPGNVSARAWEIDFTWFGMPLEFREIANAPAQAEICNVAPAHSAEAVRRGILETRGGKFFPGKTLRNYLEIIFARAI